MMRLFRNTITKNVSPLRYQSNIHSISLFSHNLFVSSSLQPQLTSRTSIPLRYFSTSSTSASSSSTNKTESSSTPKIETEEDTDSKSPQEEQSKEKEKENNLPIKRIAQDDDDYYDDYEGQGDKGGLKKWLSYMVLAGILSLVGYSGYSIMTELFGRSAPNNLFNETFELVRVNDEVMRMTGDPMRAYGMDTGRHTEGRRNFVASRRYKAGDGSNRTRIRYTVSGPRGKAIIYAEVSDQMEGHEFVYLITKDGRTGRVHTVADNRSKLEADNPAASQEQAPLNPLEALLKGGPYRG